jgi:hypothetical protein
VMRAVDEHAYTRNWSTVVIEIRLDHQLLRWPMLCEVGQVVPCWYR